MCKLDLSLKDALRHLEASLRFWVNGEEKANVCDLHFPFFNFQTSVLKFSVFSFWYFTSHFPTFQVLFHFQFAFPLHLPMIHACSFRAHACFQVSLWLHRDSEDFQSSPWHPLRKMKGSKFCPMYQLSVCKRQSERASFRQAIMFISSIWFHSSRSKYIIYDFISPLSK